MKEVLNTNSPEFLARSWLKTIRKNSVEPDEGFSCDVVEQAIQTNQRARVVSLLCANYEGQVITQDFVLGEKRTKRMPLATRHDPFRGIRRGFMALCEEVPAVLAFTKQYVGFEWTPVLVDLGSMALPPFNSENLSLELPSWLNEDLEENRAIMEGLLSIGWENYSLPGSPPKVTRLSEMAQEIGLATMLGEVCESIRWTYQKNRNSPLGHIIHAAFRENKGYMPHHWAIIDQETILAYTLFNFFALTKTVGLALPKLVSAISGRKVESRADLILLDVIPGPANKGHKEFYMYNWNQEKLLSIIRPVHNTVLFSEPAISSPWVKKPVGEVRARAEMANQIILERGSHEY
jgi:hypothetical protein